MDLGVNIDHIATLREARGTVYPDPSAAVKVAEEAGADLITVHLREDRRHIVDRDIDVIRKIVKTRMNLEMAATKEMVQIACRIRPHDVCLVPERREELTTEGGLDVVENLDQLRSIVGTLRGAGIRVSMFIDPDEAQLEASQATGAEAIELHTGAYADANQSESIELEYLRIYDASNIASELGLKVNAGHGLHYQNVQRIAAISTITELNIGHAIIAEAVFIGLFDAVSKMKNIMLEATLP